MPKRLRILSVLLGLMVVCLAASADPGDAWLTGSEVPPDGVQWFPADELCSVAQDKLPEARRTLASKPFVALTAESLASYAGTACKGKYGQFPFLVRAVSTAGVGRLDAGILQGVLWLRFAGMGEKYPFEQTPVVLWLYGPPAEVHVIANLVL